MWTPNCNLSLLKIVIWTRTFLILYDNHWTLYKGKHIGSVNKWLENRYGIRESWRIAKRGSTLYAIGGLVSIFNQTR